MLSGARGCLLLRAPHLEDVISRDTITNLSNTDSTGREERQRFKILTFIVYMHREQVGLCDGIFYACGPLWLTGEEINHTGRRETLHISAAQVCNRNTIFVEWSGAVGAAGWMCNIKSEVN